MMFILGRIVVAMNPEIFFCATTIQERKTVEVALLVSFEIALSNNNAPALLLLCNQ